MKVCIYIGFLTIQFLYCITGIAQEKNIDSLKKALPKLKDTARIDCLNEMFIHYIFKGDKGSSIFYSNIASEESRRINYRHGIAVAYVQEAAMSNHFENDFPKMEQKAREA